MTGRQIIQKLIDKTGIGNNELARRLGITPALMSSRVHKKSENDIPANLLQQTVKEMGYKVVVAKEETEIDGGMEIDGERHTIGEWCRRLGLSTPFVKYRMDVKKMDAYTALTAEKIVEGRPKKASS